MERRSTAQPHPANPEDILNDWRELKPMMKALADVARLAIIYHLARHHEVTVSDLTDLLRLSQPLVSWHLRKLRRAGLVTTHRAGRQVYCTLDLPRFQQCLHSLEHLVDPSVVWESLPVGAALIEADTNQPIP